MKRMMTTVAIAALSLGSIAVGGVGIASASTTTPTLTIAKVSPLPNQPSSIVATASVPGTVTFSAGTTPITGCSAVATATTTPYTATCVWTPTTSGAVTLTAVLAPTDTTDYAGVTATYAAVVATPVQGSGSNGNIGIYVDTILASGSTGALAPEFGAGCEITNEFIQGQTIVFRAYANDFNQGGVPLTNLNATATVTVSGYSGSPLTMAYGNHSGVAFWTAPLKTGVASTTGAYTTLGQINYTVTFTTIAVPAVTKKVVTTKVVPVLVNGKKVYVNGKLKTKKVKSTKTVVVTPAVKGTTATFNSNFAATSIATLNALPSK